MFRIKTLVSAVLMHTFLVSLLLPGLATAAPKVVQQQKCPLDPFSVGFLEAGTLIWDEYEIPWELDFEDGLPEVSGDIELSYSDMLSMVEVIDENQIVIGDATLTRLGTLDLWVVEAEICEWNGDMGNCEIETLGLLQTDGFDLAEAIDVASDYVEMADLKAGPAIGAAGLIVIIVGGVAIVVSAVVLAVMCANGGVEFEIQHMGSTFEFDC